MLSVPVAIRAEGNASDVLGVALQRVQLYCGGGVPNFRRAVPVACGEAGKRGVWRFPRTEAVLHGLCEAFDFFAAVPKELWWDNPTTVAIHNGSGRTRTLHSRYAALASHYLFAAKFCMPATPQEKPRAYGPRRPFRRIFA